MIILIFQIFSLEFCKELTIAMSFFLIYYLFRFFFFLSMFNILKNLELNWEAKCPNYSSDRTWQHRSLPFPVLSSHHWLPTKSRLNSKYLSWPRRSSEAKIYPIHRSWQHLIIPRDHSAVRPVVLSSKSRIGDQAWLSGPPAPSNSR